MGLSKDWEALRDSVEAALRQQLADISEGLAGDLDGPIREASNRLVVAIRSNRPDLTAEIKDQLALLFTQNKLRAKGALANSGVIETIIGTGINMLINGALGGLAAVKAN